MQKLTVSSLVPYILRSQLETHEMNQLVLDHFKETSIPLTALRQGLTLQQGYNKQVKMNRICSLHDINHLEFDHWILQDKQQPMQWRCDLWWNVFHNTRYNVTNPEYTGRCALVHTVDPQDLGLPKRPDGCAILLYTYEGEELCSLLEGNSFCFPGLDPQDCFIHCQGNEILSGKQQRYGVYFPLFPHADTLDNMETMLIPNVISMPDPPIRSAPVPDPTPIHTKYPHRASPRAYTILRIGPPLSLPPSVPMLYLLLVSSLSIAYPQPFIVTTLSHMSPFVTIPPPYASSILRPLPTCTLYLPTWFSILTSDPRSERHSI